MSQENVEILRRMVDAWNRGDLDECFADFAPEGEWRTTGRFADEGVYRGREAIERLFTEIRDDLEEQSFLFPTFGSSARTLCWLGACGRPGGSGARPRPRSRSGMS